MDFKLTAEIHREGGWFVGFRQEVPEANGQGRTPEDCLGAPDCDLARRG